MTVEMSIAVFRPASLRVNCNKPSLKPMDIQTRMRRRQSDTDDTLVLEQEAISPVAHVADPVGRGTTLERLLDYLEPMLNGTLPPEAYIWGPAGAGKSAVVAALFAQLQSQQSRPGSIIHTASPPNRDHPQSVVYVDARSATSDFGLYHAVLDELIETAVPTKGVRTETMRDRLQEALGPCSKQVLVAVDHIGEAETMPLSELAEKFEDIDTGLSWVAIGRSDPASLDSKPPTKRIRIPAYDRQALIDIITSRALSGLGPHTLEHRHARHIAEWADGNAHDALAALFTAADRVVDRSRSTIRKVDLRAALEATPRSGVALGKVLLLPDSRQRVLRALVDIGDGERSPVSAVASKIADDDDVDLSAGTVKRYLYELAEDGIVERIQIDESTQGRPPSRIEPQFLTYVFERLAD